MTNKQARPREYNLSPGLASKTSRERMEFYGRPTCPETQPMAEQKGGTRPLALRWLLGCCFETRRSA